MAKQNPKIEYSYEQIWILDDEERIKLSEWVCELSESNQSESPEMQELLAVKSQLLQLANKVTELLALLNSPI